MTNIQTKYGDWILCDTDDGECAVWSFWEPDEYMRFSNAEECFSYFKKSFLELKVFPIGKTKKMRELWDKDGYDEEIRKAARKCGWPSEEFSWEKFFKTAMAEIDDFSDEE